MLLPALLCCHVDTRASEALSYAGAGVRFSYPASWVVFDAEWRRPVDGMQLIWMGPSDRVVVAVARFPVRSEAPLANADAAMMQLVAQILGARAQGPPQIVSGESVWQSIAGEVREGLRRVVTAPIRGRTARMQITLFEVEAGDGTALVLTLAELDELRAAQDGFARILDSLSFS